MELTRISGLIGGIGLFMLGMHLMTEGLKIAAGQGLRTVLKRSTEGTFRAIVSGALITSLVQSSGAVTVAAIGFVNAGLMGLRRAIVVIYGSNIGTTMTGWMVVLVGINVNIKALALPAIGIGMLAHFIRGPGRSGGAGYALAGFGVFFLGIDVLHQTFATLAATLTPYTTTMTGTGGILLLVGIGILLTTAMQSSSAAIALALTFPIWITVNYLGSPDNGVIIASYVGSLLMAGAFLAIGACLSATTKNQVVAFIIAAVVSFLFLMSGLDMVLSFFKVWLPEVLVDAIAGMSFLTHFNAITNGVIDLRDIVFFGSLIGLFLYANVVVVDVKKAA